MQPPSSAQRVKLFCVLLCLTLLTQTAALRLTSASSAGSAHRSATPRPTAGRAAQPPTRQANRREGALLVRFREGVSEAEVDSVSASYGLRRDGRLRGESGVERLALLPGQTMEAVLPALRSTPSVEFAEPDLLITADQARPNDPRFAEQWSLGGGRGAHAPGGVNAAAAWSQTTGSASVLVAVIDSGLDFSHPDLRDNLWTNGEQTETAGAEAGGYAGDLHGWDWVTNSAGAGDESGHGTAVAGVIAAVGNNGEGVAGVMWRAGLMSLRVLDRENKGSVSDAVEAIDYAVAHGALVINCSWGTDEPSDALRQAVERAIARGVTVVCSAGNGGRSVDESPRYPASFNLPSLIAVAASGASDKLTASSNYGARQVALAAPGDGVLTTKAGGGYAPASGTSVAAAFVSGIAGLVRTLRPRLSAARTQELILRGVRSVKALEGRVASGGVADATGALAAIGLLQPGEGVGANRGQEDATQAGGAVGQAGYGASRAPASENRLRVAPPAPGQGTAGGNMPDLDVERRVRHGDPQVLKPVPSTRRRCPPHNPRCNEGGDPRPNASPTPGNSPAPRPQGNEASLASLASRSLLAVMSAALNGGRPVIEVPLLDYVAGGQFAVSDSSPALLGPDHARLVASAAPATLQAGTNASVFVSQDVPAVMAAGRQYLVSVRMRNTGTTTWSPSGNYNLGSQNPQDNSTWGAFRASVLSNVPPGAETNVNFTVTAPATPGTYNFQWRMVQDGVEWFGAYSNNVSVTVTPSGGYDAAADFSAVQNPAGTWSYGYRPSGGSFVPYASNTSIFGAGSDTWSSGYCCPVVVNNKTGATYTYPNAPSVIQPAGMLNLHPGPNGERSVVRWTAPVAGTYLVSGRFQGIDTAGTTTDVAVTHNYMAAMFNGLVSGYGAQAPFSFGRTLAAGDYLEFSAGYGANSNYNNDSTGLLVTITPALAGHWRLDDGAGATALDSSGNGNVGTLQGGAAWAQGAAGAGALSFDGVDDYVQVGNRLSMLNGMTFSAWMYPTGTGSAGVYGGVIVNKEGEYEIARFQDGTIQWAFANSNPGWTWVNTGYVAPLNQWTHIAITYDYGVVKTYANGQLVHTYQGYGALGDVDGALNDFRIGGRQAGSQYFQGRLDEVRVYSATLLQPDVAKLAADHSYGGAPVGLPGNIEAEQFDQGGEGTGYHDATPGTHGQDYTQPPNYPPPAFRQPTDVDIYKSPDYSGGYLVVMQAGDWMNYTVDVATAGTYNFDARTYFWGSSGGTFHVEFDGVNKTGSLQMPGGAVWGQVSKSGIQLTAGRHVMRVVCDTNAPGDYYLGDIDYMRLVPAEARAGGGGLTGEYFDNIDFTGYAMTRTDAAVNFDWAGGAPSPSMGVDDFTVRWTGTVVPRYNESYTFYTTTDDGVRLWLDGQLIIDHWVDQAPYEWASSPVTLEAGRAYAIRMEFYERGGGALAWLKWSSASEPKDFIPQSQLNGCWKGADQFTNDFFQGALVRRPTAAEFSDWTGRLAQAQGDDQLVAEARSLAGSVFKSTEYVNRNRTDSDYVSDLYLAFLQRAPDQSGWNFWTNEIAGCGTNQQCRDTKRADVRRAFEQSGEFTEKVRDLCGTSAASPVNSGVGYNFATARLDPNNRTGGGGVDPYSRNFNFSIPLVSLPGRSGLDLGLTLSYNSLVWTKDGAGGITFDPDQGFPGPGFRLGFPAIQPRFFNPQTGKYTYMLITPAGGRVELRQVGTSNVYESADSTYLQLTDNGTLTLTSTDGKRLTFSLMNGEYRCTEVKDRNGNYLSADYYTDGRLNQVFDTLGRVVIFRYDTYLNLTKIEQQWKRETEAAPTGADEPHLWATFGYTNLTLLPQFSNLAVVGEQPGTVIPVVNQVGLDDGSYYKFSYNQWGQVWKVTHYAADSVVNNVAQDTHALSSMRFDLPGSDLQAASPQADCPRFTQQTAWVENGIMDQSAEATTTYGQWSADMVSCSTTAPDGTVSRDVYGTGWQRGMTLQSEVMSGGQSRKLTTLLMEHDGAANAAYPTNPRVKKSTIDDSGRRRVTEVTEFAAYGLPKVVKEYDTDGTTVLRRTEVDYKLDPAADSAYLNQRLIGLVKERRVYDGAGTLASKTGYVYDQSGSLSDQGAATRHDTAYGQSFLTRGNVTTLQQWDASDGSNSSKIIEQRTAYNTNGSIISRYVYEPGAQTQNVTQFEYTDNFSDGQSRSTFAYPTKVTDPDGYTTSTWYNYQTGVEFKTQTPQPNTVQNLSGPTFTSYYDAAGRVKKTVNSVNGAYTEWDYPDSMTLVKSYTTIADNSIPAQNQNLRSYSATALDGAGRVRGTARSFPGSVGGYTGQRLLRDIMGRVEYQSNPTEMTTANGAWTPAGDDANNGVWRWSRQEYDWNARPTVTTNPDGSQKIATYAGCGCAGSDVVTLRDEVGRLQKVYHDALGRQYKTEHLYPDGTVYRTIRNDFDALDHVTTVTEQVGTAGASQVTTTQYDGYGRAWKTKEPEATGPKVLEYFNDGRVKKETDARGASATYSYNGRGMVTYIDYVAQTGGTDAPDVGFGFDAAGNRLWMTDGVGRVDYSYDALSRVEWESRQFSQVWNPTASDGRYKLSYQYTLDGQPRNITDPFGARIDYTYDTVGRLTDVGGTPFNNTTQYASNMKYRAWGDYKSIGYGDGLTVQYNYNERLNPSEYDLRDSAAARQLSVKYQYYDDARVRFIDDLREDRFDRLYEYDEMGRLKKAESGYKARQAPYPGNNSQNGPYNHYYAYDAFDNLTSRTGAYWYKESGETFTATYLNNRNQNSGWQYDADGRVIQSVVAGSTTTYNNNYTYNAAGQRTDVGRYDGDGLQIKSTDGTACFVRSSVLNGQVISEVWSEAYSASFEFGRKIKTYVYVGGEPLAEQRRTYYSQPAGEEWMVWKRQDPKESSVHLNDYMNSSANTPQLRQLALDAQGIATEAPDYTRLNQNPTYYNQSYSTYNYMGYGSYTPSWGGATGGVPGNFGSGCTIDGASAPCGIAISLWNSNAAWQCPPSGCGARQVDGRLVPFNSSTGDWTPQSTLGYGFVTGTIDANTGAGMHVYSQRQGRPRDNQRHTAPPETVLPPGTQTWPDDGGPNTSPISREEAERCDEILRKLFTKQGSGGIAAGSGFNPTTLRNDPKMTLGYNDQHFRPHLWSAMHIFATSTGEMPSSPVGLYIPAGVGRGQTKLYSYEHGRYDTFYQRLGNLQNVTLITSHVANFRVNVKDTNGEGSVRIGNVGGRGGESPNGLYIHSHLSIKTSNGRFVSFYDAFCKK